MAHLRQHLPGAGKARKWQQFRQSKELAEAARFRSPRRERENFPEHRTCKEQNGRRQQSDWLEENEQERQNAGEGRIAHLVHLSKEAI